MAKLSYEHRKHMSAHEFAIPSKKEYPIEDKSHARNAKARASMAEHEGHISKATKEMIDRKADRKLHSEHDGKKEHHKPEWK
jgi:hypothetical protein